MTAPSCVTEQTRVLRRIWRGGPCAFPRGLQSGVLPRLCCQAPLVGRGCPGGWMRAACSSEGNAVAHHLDRIAGGTKVLLFTRRREMQPRDGRSSNLASCDEEGIGIPYASGEPRFCLLAARQP